jgi:hypothetical protein
MPFFFYEGDDVSLNFRKKNGGSAMYHRSEIQNSDFLQGEISVPVVRFNLLRFFSSF